MKLEWLRGVALCLALVPAAAPYPVEAQTRTDMLLGGDESAVDPLIEALNQSRVMRGVEPLTVDPRLSGAASRLAEDAGYETWSEGDPLDGLVPRARAADEMAVEGYEAASFGVALALSPETVDRVLQALVGEAEEGVEAKLVSATYRDVGLGRSWVEGMPFYVVLVAKERLGEADLAAVTAGLENVDGVRREMLKKLNKARKSEKRPLVKANRCLDTVAQNQASDMLERDWFGHVSPEGHDAIIRVTGGHCVFRSAAENVARGVFGVDEALDFWLATEAEREVLLDRRYSDMGFGLAQGETDEGLQVYWVVVYGSQEGRY